MARIFMFETSYSGLPDVRLPFASFLLLPVQLQQRTDKRRRFSRSGSVRPPLGPSEKNVGIFALRTVAEQQPGGSLLWLRHA
jgi:hypothetical protein